MKKRTAVVTVMAMLVVIHIFILSQASQVIGSTVSGEVINGYRVINLEKYPTPAQLVVYRGDYIKFIHNLGDGPKVVTIPDLKIEAHLKVDPESVPYFKMKKSGRYKMMIDQVEGVIDVVDYDQPNYREMTAAEGLRFIKDSNPLILDVRTPQEYNMGRLADAKLVPVQVLQQRLGELADFKDKDILIYCATGNRSTVASKILNDQGFTKISNLRRGIVDWHQRGLPVVK